jgi:hypothetical protein
MGKTIVLAVLSFLIAVPAYGSQGEAEDAAIEAALEWLKPVDAGDYGSSWEEAAELFRNAVSKGDWERSLGAAREPLGALVGRRVESAVHTTELPGAPDGHYVVIQFRSSFDNKRSAVETVTPMLQNDGVWKVSGYYIR